jgi:hypothetical protein
MSKPILPDEPIVRREPEDQVRYYANLFRRAAGGPAKLAWFKAHTVGLGMHFSDDELVILAALDAPTKVQEFLNTQIYYNDDHASKDSVETAMSPRSVLRSGMAHCFEGAMFAYTVNFLHRHNPRFVLLEASQDPDHNLVVVQDPQTGLYGVNAHSAWPHLDGRPAQFPTVRAIAESYYPYYISDLTQDPNDHTLVGYSEPFDLTRKFGVAWMGSTEPLWDLYYTYIDDSVRFHYLPEASDEPHLYPLVRALKDKWIQVDGAGKAFVSIADLPMEGQKLWHAFWRCYDPASNQHPHGEARDVEKQFMRLTGTTPIDLQVNAGEFQGFLEHGYRTEQLFTSNQHPPRS